jgi:hypothetical protein
MAKQLHEDAASTEAPSDLTNVVPFQRPGPDRKHQPRPTDDELAEYRAMKPKLMKMLQEWDTLKSQHGCPIAHGIFGD